MRRVVVTGIASITALGNDWDSVRARLERGDTAVRRMADWDRFTEMNTRLAAPIPDFELPPHFTRKKTRTMGRVAKMSTLATENALRQAGLFESREIENGSMGVAYGSCTGSTDAAKDFVGMLVSGEMGNINATTYIRMMSHTAAVNIGVHFKLKGRVIPTSSACTSGSQGLGYAYEAIKYGMQDMMVAGGSEELCVSEAAVFDTLFATSRKNDAPHTTPSPFDETRDGLVLGEGACSFVLEEREHAVARGAPIIAEILGFGSNSDGSHVTQPNTETMEVAMRMALKDARLSPDAIGYVSAHGTATEQGDIAESGATERVFGSKTPVSSMKGHLGHTLGACGAIESWLAIEMMRNNWFAPTANLHRPDDRCGKLDYIVNEGRKLETDIVMNNNFAFGGINTSLIFGRVA